MSNRKYFIVGFICLALIWCAPSVSLGDAARSPEHIFIITMENRSDKAILGDNPDAPFLNKLAKEGMIGTNFYGTTHPSLPNYLALISGSTQGIWDNCRAGADVFCQPITFSPFKKPGPKLTQDQFAQASKVAHFFDSKTLIDQLEERRISWKAYFQSMPEHGFKGEFASNHIRNGRAGTLPLYAQKHNPFLYFKSIAQNEGRLKKIAPFEEFHKDAAAGNLPALVWITPDQCRDMHGVTKEQAAALGLPDCAFAGKRSGEKIIKLGDDFLAQVIAQIRNSAAWREDALIAVIWDEDDYSGAEGCCRSPIGAQDQALAGGKIPAIFLRSRPGAIKEIRNPANHYTLLRAMQDAWGLECLGESCAVDAAELGAALFR